MPPSFTFPPPPPPPPAPSAPAPPNSTGPRSAQRGGHQHSRGRARGGGANNYRGHGPRRTFDWDRPVQRAGQPPWAASRSPSYTPQYQSGPKRTYGQAFASSARNVPLGKAPPAVPSFGEPLPTVAIPLTKSLPDALPRPKKDRTFNQLGLTPRKVEHESSEEEDDEDEEARLGAASQQLGRGTLQFEHRGQLMTLGTPEEIQAWISERKKRYPTKAKVAEAIAAKDRLKQRASNGPKRESQPMKPRQRPIRKPAKAAATVSPNVRTGHKHSEVSRVKVKRHAESSTAQHDSRKTRNTVEPDAYGSEDSPWESSSESDWTSSSGISEATDDSDDGPMEQSAKLPVAALSLASSDVQRPSRRDLSCPRQRRSGRCCLRGCSYKHTKSYRNSNSARTAEPSGEPNCNRVSLQQRLLAQQHNEEDRNILRYIMAIGERGLFDASK